MAELPQHIEADLTLLRTEQSGRRAPIYTGFRALFACDGRESDVIHTLVEQQEFAFPGERLTVFITFRTPERQAGRLAAGKHFELREEGRVIGRGEVRRVLSLTPTASTLPWG